MPLRNFDRLIRRKVILLNSAGEVVMIYSDPRTAAKVLDSAISTVYNALQTGKLLRGYTLKYKEANNNTP